MPDQIPDKPDFDEFSHAFAADLYRYLVWLCKDPDLASDVAQETWLRAWRSWDKLRDGKAAKQWVLTIGRREFYRFLDRRRDHHYNLEEAMISNPQYFATQDVSHIDDVRDGLWRLEDEYREPLVLQVLMGYTTEEIAQTMGLKQGAVLTRLFRARKKLKVELEKQDENIGPRSNNVTPIRS
ncbi:MAG: sigma-70 family RNA polymerase sigma factor [Gammaproteobacteria bacterium]|nr:sigma-70 family RNA polymerase sigma factor [Gammaproteobacteria bacterium]NNC98126.1 sigma-70 family RNA polymerase sigma factor [Gammaproteobacteria bacterium]NNM14008.1 sigma-70 family RNA polymerase sigma factor [Gammaproteobacteria bacterium]